MSENSRFWNGTASGDATEAPYDADTEFAAVMNTLAMGDQSANLGGVYLGTAHGLQATMAVAGVAPVLIDTGKAFVYGTWYNNTGSVSVAVPSPIGATRIDRIVLRKSWGAQTARLVRIPGIEGGSAPNLIQVAGTTWDIPLWKTSTTVGGVVTLTDERECLGMRPGTYIWDSVAATRLNCQKADHTAISRASYPVLKYFYIDLLAGVYGTGDGLTTFNVPPHYGRSPLMLDSGSVVVTGFTTIGLTGGEQNHALTSGETGAHTHGITDPNHTHVATTGSHGHNSVDSTGTQGNTGGNAGSGPLVSTTLAPNTTTTSVTSTAPVNTPAVSNASAATGISTVSAGSGTGHNTMHPVHTDQCWVFLGGL